MNIMQKLLCNAGYLPFSYDLRSSSGAIIRAKRLAFRCYANDSLGAIAKNVIYHMENPEEREQVLIEFLMSKFGLANDDHYQTVIYFPDISYDPA